MNGERNIYEEAGYKLLSRHHVKVEKWRSSNSGIAYTYGADTIEAPPPRGPVSFAVLAHEVGHIVLHTLNGRYPRWKEEVEAWEFALRALGEFDLPGYERVERFARSRVHGSFLRAVRRGVDPDLIEDTFPAWWPREDEE